MSDNDHQDLSPVSTGIAGKCPPFWAPALIAIALLVLLPLALLRPAKGIVLNRQWKTSAREGRRHS